METKNNIDKKFNKAILIIVFVILFLLVGTRLIKTQEDIKQTEIVEKINLSFKDNEALKGHYNKHGKEMGYTSKEDYLNGANALINNPNALHKLEKEDGDHVYYLEETNEIAFVSKDGIIRTYFCPDNGKAYFDKQ